MSEPSLSAFIWSARLRARGDEARRPRGEEAFANSPDLQNELMNAIMDALEAHTLMSQQALNSETVRSGIKDILLNHTRLWEALRSKGGAARPEEP